MRRLRRSATALPTPLAADIQFSSTTSSNNICVDTFTPFASAVQKESSVYFSGGSGYNLPFIYEVVVMLCVRPGFNDTNHTSNQLIYTMIGKLPLGQGSGSIEVYSGSIN
jgi:hypothetical protein